MSNGACHKPDNCSFKLTVTDVSATDDQNHQSNGQMSTSFEIYKCQLLTDSFNRFYHTVTHVSGSCLQDTGKNSRVSIKATDALKRQIAK